ncbi:MAG: adenylyltransferase/cytidyltransferase family protein [Proteobacteria bacterium]|nr:adenylyltransferase/cytidyltransferase family protein [Pseudomonadota bacterium]
MTEKKIMDVKRLAQVVTEARHQGKRVVHCHGVFDFLHIGHIRYFEQARAMGDVLVVTLTPDRFVDKGPHRPAFTETLRVEAIASLSCVDYVAINEWPTAEETLQLIHPDIYVKGSEFKNIQADMTGKIAREEKVARDLDIRLAFTDDIVFSSTSLINRFISVYPQEVNEYLDLFRNRHPRDDVLAVIDRMATLKVLVIGDVIVDEYVYCEAIGKFSKDPVLAVKYLSEDRFAGGVLAVANYVANFAGQVELISVLGNRNHYEPFIRAALNKKIKPDFFTVEGIPTVVKRRILDGYSLNKLIEIYDLDERELPPAVSEAICTTIRERAAKADVVLISDFGHGAINDQIIETLCETAPFLAINTQANVGNRGFHTISRYPRADYACIAEHEMRLEARDARGELRPILEQTCRRLKARYMIVTRGQWGCLVSGAGDEFAAVPAFACKVVDRAGAGDAFLAVTALAAAQKIPFEVLGFIGNVVGAEAVEIVGNDKAIDKLKIKKCIVSLLK